jgi:eukaryotic-like serine/threonine-protein kinase
MQSHAAPNFGRYQILAETGRGAMGVVYKARDPKIDRIVAIKTIALSQHLSTEEKEFRERFFVEAKAAGRLSHPAIVTIYDVGEDSQTQNPFIVMEYVEGESLDQQSSDPDNARDSARALSLVRDLARALDYAHSQGIVHRDIKPANILLTREGQPKITDFGVAKLNMAYQTVAGQSLGTPAYMSPEQLNGDPVDGRSDLFSLGVILYTLLTGHRPFQGNSAMTVSFRVVHREPLPVSAYDSNFPPDVDYVIGRAIAKDAVHRYQSGGEMADDLDDLSQGLTPRSKGKQSASRRKDNGSSTQASAGTPASTQRVRQIKTVSGTTVHKTSRGARQWSMWDYAALALLTLGVTAMAITVLRPFESSGLSPIPAQISRRSVAAKTGAAVSAPPIPADKVPGSAQNSVLRTNRTGAGATSLVSPRESGSTKQPLPIGSVPEPVRGTANSPITAAMPRKDANLHIRVEHRFPSAQVLVWVDDQLAYKESSDATVKRRMVLFKEVKGYKSDSIPLVSGEHKIRVRVQSTDDSYDRTAVINGIVPPNAERELKIDCTNRKQIHLSMQ